MRVPAGHWLVLQGIVSSRAGHVSPPFFGSSMTSRALILVPPPQVTLHSPHGFQSPTLQSTKYPQFSKDIMMKIKKGQEHLGIFQCCRALSPPEPDMSLPHILVLRWPLLLSSWFHHHNLHYIHPKQSTHQPCNQLEMSSFGERVGICNAGNKNGITDACDNADCYPLLTIYPRCCPLFQKYSTWWVFSIPYLAVPGFSWLCRAIPGCTLVCHDLPFHGIPLRETFKKLRREKLRPKNTRGGDLGGTLITTQVQSSELYIPNCEKLPAEETADRSDYFLKMNYFFIL